MGNGASSSQTDKANGNWKNKNGSIKAKAVAAANFGKQCANDEITKYSRQDLIDFLCEQRKERHELNSALDVEETSVDRFRIRPKTAGPRRSAKETDWRKVQVKVESDAACYLCDETITFLISGYPCRVCTRIFHKECLEEYEGCRVGDLDMMERAHCITGWSCYRCGDLTTLLTNEETRIMIEEFDKRDINGDGLVTKDEYLKYKSREYEEEEQEPIPEQELRRHRLMYHVMDSDRDGAVDWWEFVNQECTRVLAKRKKEDLAQLLTDKETLRLKEQFEAMDDMEDGVITEFTLCSIGTNGTSFDQKLHNPCPQMTVSWEQFKNEQALYVLSNRPNIRMPSRNWND